MKFVKVERRLLEHRHLCIVHLLSILRYSLHRIDCSKAEVTDVVQRRLEGSTVGYGLRIAVAIVGGIDGYVVVPAVTVVSPTCSYGSHDGLTFDKLEGDLWGVVPIAFSDCCSTAAVSSSAERSSAHHFVCLLRLLGHWCPCQLERRRKEEVVVVLVPVLVTLHRRPQSELGSWLQISEISWISWEGLYHQRRHPDPVSRRGLLLTGQSLQACQFHRLLQHLI